MMISSVSTPNQNNEVGTVFADTEPMSIIVDPENNGYYYSAERTFIKYQLNDVTHEATVYGRESGFMDYLAYSCLIVIPMQVKIQDEVTTYTVTSIADYAFSEWGVRSFAIPASIRSIGDSAFASNEFVSVTIPSNIKHAGFAAFGYSSTIVSVRIENGAEDIEDAFFGCNGLKEVWTASSASISGISYTGMEELRWTTWYKYKSTDGINIVSDGNVSYTNVKGNNGEYVHYFKTNSPSDNNLYILGLNSSIELASSGTNLWIVDSNNRSNAYMVCLSSNGFYGPLPQGASGESINWKNGNTKINPFDIIQNNNNLTGTVPTFPNTGVGVDVIVPSVMILTLTVAIVFVAINNKKTKVIVKK